MGGPASLRRIHDTDLWYVTTELPAGSRVEYQFELVRGEHREQYVNDPLNLRLAHGPFGSSSVLSATGTRCRTGAGQAGGTPRDVVEQVLTSKALRRECTSRSIFPRPGPWCATC